MGGASLTLVAARSGGGSFVMVVVMLHGVHILAVSGYSGASMSSDQRIDYVLF